MEDVNASAIRRHAWTVFVSAVVVSALYMSTLVRPSTVEALAQSLGFAGPLLVALSILATQIVAPFSGAPFMFVGIKLYGYPKTMLLFYVVSMCSAVINFFIARLYGRAVIRRLVGEKTLADIDALAEHDAANMVFWSRIFGYYFFDIISYAAGLTTIRLSTYLAYTAFVSLLPFGFFYFIFRDLDFNSARGVFTYYVALVATAVVFGFFARRVYRQAKNSARPQQTA